MLKCSWVHNSMIAGQPMFLSAMDGLMPWMDWYNRMYSNRSCKTVNPRISRFVVDLRERHLEYWTPYFEIHPRDRTQQQTLYLLPMPFFSAANKSACYMNLTQQTTGHFFASVRYHTLICGFQARLWGEGKENIWFGGVSTKPHLLHTCLKTRLSYNIFGTLYAINSINLATNSSWTSLHMLLMPLVWQQDKCRAECSWVFPWLLGMTQRAVITKDVSDGKNNTTNLLLSCNNNTPPTAGWGKNNLKKRRQMRWLNSLTLAAQRCTSWWLQLNVLTFLLFLLSHGLSTFNHILCNPKKVLLTYYLDNYYIYLHGISYSVANCGLDKFFLLTLQSHPVLVEDTETWTLPFNVAMSEHLCTSYPLYILWLPPLKKAFQTWTRNPAQVLTLSLLLSSNTRKKWFGIIVVRVTLKTCRFPFLLTCSICFCQTVSPHIFGTKLKSRLYTKKVQLHPHRIIAC